MSASVQICMPFLYHTEFTLLGIQFLVSGLLAAASLQRNSIIMQSFFCASGVQIQLFTCKRTETANGTVTDCAMPIPCVHFY